jgi:hypothetical protein
MVDAATEACMNPGCALEEGDGSTLADANTDAEDEAYVDRRWRKIMLIPHGDAWLQKCRHLAEMIMTEEHTSGLIMAQWSGPS